MRLIMKNVSKEDFYNHLNKAKSILDLFHLIGYKSNSGVPLKTIKKYNELFNCDIKSVIEKNNEIRKENQNKFDEPHICKNCGKEFTEKYSKWSDGNFCCRKCANIFSSKIDKNNVNKKVSNILQHKYREEYYKNPKKCCFCNNIIPYEKRTRKTCCNNCKNNLLKENSKNRDFSYLGGYVENSCRGHHGHYKKIYCDSTYELAYLIYCLDHNIDIKRCNKTFEYEYEGKIHKYHPDFEVEGIIVEIKNYNSNIVNIKANAVTEPYKILYKEDLQEVFEYVAKTYNKHYDKSSNNFYELYDEFFSDR